MSEKNVIKNEEIDENAIGKFYIQSVSFDTFLKIVKDVNLIGTAYFYSMPNHIKTYAKDVEGTTQSIFSIFENEDERWRVKSIKQLHTNVTENSIQFGDFTILDSDLCLCMPMINSIVLLPGQKSIENGWDVTKIVLLSSMISMTPMLLRLTDIEDEENPPNHKISVSYETISQS